MPSWPCVNGLWYEALTVDLTAARYSTEVHFQRCEDTGLTLTSSQFRSNWVVDPNSGEYQAHLKSPTGIPSDPALTSHGVNQAKELAVHLKAVQPPVEKVFSSPYYRCLQTVQPFIQILEEQSTAGSGQDAPAGTGQKPAILGETGLSEWYGAAPFQHPTSAPPAELKALFPAYDTAYVPAVAPARTGETIAQLHERVACTLDTIIQRCDDMGVRAVLLCSHAATIIAIGRVLTGQMPENVETEDFRVFTCGLSTFRRRQPAATNATGEGDNAGRHASASHLDWKSGAGVGGGWICEVNSDCSFLSSGEERGW